VLKTTFFVGAKVVCVFANSSAN